MTPPSADDQTAPSAFPAWSLQTEVARLRELLRQREEQLEHAAAELTRLRAALEAAKRLDLGREQEIDRLDNKVDLLRGELTRLRAERDELNAQLAEHAAATQHYLQQAADAKVLLREDRAKSTALLIDLRALVEGWKCFSESDELWIKNLETLEQAEPDEDLPDIVRERMIVRNQCIEALAARLSREPGADQ